MYYTGVILVNARFQRVSYWSVLGSCHISTAKTATRMSAKFDFVYSQHDAVQEKTVSCTLHSRCHNLGHAEKNPQPGPCP